MSWTFSPSSAPIEHEAGAVPPRPLAVGDLVFFNGHGRTVTASSPSLLMFDFDGWGNGGMPQFRDAVEGDFSKCITAIEETAS